MNGIHLLEKGAGRDLLKRYCRRINIPVAVIEELVDVELDQVGRIRRRGMFERFDEALSRSPEVVDEGPT
ncbi:MAG: hypothetical protein H6716_28620 [Polyangiaceae bacterium]|nr:hypothetical protein [Polyangiaceae bacterium]